MWTGVVVVQLSVVYIIDGLIVDIKYLNFLRYLKKKNTGSI